MALHPIELHNALSALASLETHKIEAVKPLEFWGRRLRYAVSRYQLIGADHPQREDIAAGIRVTLARYERLNRAISLAGAEDSVGRRVALIQMQRLKNLDTQKL